jgi:site-specific recombinase XerD
MLREGATMMEIAEILRHRSLNTTRIYAKVDLKGLREIAKPWPEIRP